MQIAFRGVLVAFLSFAVLAPMVVPMMTDKAMAANTKKKEKKAKRKFTSEERKKAYEWAREQCSKQYKVRVARVHVDFYNMRYTCWIQ